MNSSYAAIRVPPSLVFAYLVGSLVGHGTATTISIGGVEQRPTATFDLEAQIKSDHGLALDWLAFSKAVLPSARPLTPDERASVNEFFWSHFE
jgi:hypothetical protein